MVAHKACTPVYSKKQASGDTLGCVAENRHKRGKVSALLCVGGMLSRLWFSQCVDTPKPPFILSIPKRHLCSLCCSWSCGQDAASPTLFSSFLHPPPSCTLVFPLAFPSPTEWTMFLYTSFYTCISAPSNMSLMHNKECACMSVHACPWTEAASATHLPVEKSRDVIDCYSYSNSESVQRIGTPPP